jgi:hypothetical protein
VLKGLDGSDKSANKVDAKAMQMGTFSNLVWSGGNRAESGIMTALT